MQLLNETEASRTWLVKGEEATAIAQGYATMLQRLDAISARARAATEAPHEKLVAAIDALHLKFEADQAALKAAHQAEEQAALKPFGEEATKESADFHQSIYSLNPEMTTGNMPQININQYDDGGTITILERF